MKKLTLTFAALFFLATPVHATHTEDGHLHDITVNVHGLVCDFCARAVEKVFGNRAEVQAVDVDLDTHSVFIDLKPEMNIEDEEVTKMIADSGYSVVGITRPQE